MWPDMHKIVESGATSDVPIPQAIEGKRISVGVRMVIPEGSKLRQDSLD